MKTDYIYNRLNYEEIVNQSHHETTSAKLRRIVDIAKSNKEIHHKVNKREFKMKEISVKLRSLIHGMIKNIL